MTRINEAFLLLRGNACLQWIMNVERMDACVIMSQFSNFQSYE